jgi:cell division septum initiation protein DivIVA
MDIEFLLQRIEEYVLKESPKLPFTGSRMVNEEEVRGLLQQVREAIPAEVAKARDLLARRDAVLEEARQQAAQIIADAEKEAKRLTEDHRLVQEARQQAAQIRRQAQEEAERLRADADEYVFNSLSRLQEELLRMTRVVENGLRKLEEEREQRLRKP